jgi:hypothetical protein
VRFIADSQPRHRKPYYLATVIAAIGLGTYGCTGKFAKLDSTSELPKEIPKEMREQYEVTEVGAPAPSPTPVISGVGTAPEVGKPGKKKGKGKKGAPEVFTYPTRRPKKDPIWVGEKQTFDITYFGMSAGDVTFEVLPFKAIRGRKVYHIRGVAKSSKVFSLFYTLDDMIESFMDFEGLFTHRFRVLLDESKQQRDALELNDSEKAQTFYWNRWNHKTNGYSETKEFAPMQPFSQDSLSALYYMRTLPMPTGAVIEFPVVSEAKSWDAVITVIRREIMQTPFGRTQVIVVKPETKFQGVLQKKGDSYLWLTDDDRRFVVRLEAKVKIGTVIADLKKVELGNAPQD